MLLEHNVCESPHISLQTKDCVKLNYADVINVVIWIIPGAVSCSQVIKHHDWLQRCTVLIHLHSNSSVPHSTSTIVNKRFKTPIQVYFFCILISHVTFTIVQKPELVIHKRLWKMWYRKLEQFLKMTRNIVHLSCQIECLQCIYTTMLISGTVIVIISKPRLSENAL